MIYPVDSIIQPSNNWSHLHKEYSATQWCVLSIFKTNILVARSETASLTIMRKKFKQRFSHTHGARITKLTSRNSQNLQIPLYKTATGQRKFLHRTVLELWNSFDSALKLKPLLKDPTCLRTLQMHQSGTH